jgi:uncharacterized coiled-coil protein SlyX
MICQSYHATPSATFNDEIQDAAHQALVVLCEEIRQDLHDKQVIRINENYTQRIEDLQAWDRAQERKIQELQDQNATQEAIIKVLREQLERTGQEVPE